MSFSKEIKSEIAKSKISNNLDLVKIEVLGFFLCNFENIYEGIHFQTENKDIIVRYIYMLKNILDFVVVEDDSINSKNTKNIKYMLDVINMNDYVSKVDNILAYMDKVNSQEEIIAFLRGILLGGGYISTPKKNNHLEIRLTDEKNAKLVSNKLEELDISNNVSKKDKYYVVYIKNGENISNFLIYLGANVGLLNFEEARIEKEMNNNLNRVINCETANMSKIIKSAKEQIDDISVIKKANRYKGLDEGLKKVCDMRLKNPEISLNDLAELVGISKSGLNNRLRRIKEIANEIRGK